MKIALDPFMFRHVPLTELPGLVADLGYEYIELSPREDFLPFYRHPRHRDGLRLRLGGTRPRIGDPQPRTHPPIRHQTQEPARGVRPVLKLRHATKRGQPMRLAAVGAQTPR